MQLVNSEIENEISVDTFSPEIKSPIIDVDKIPSSVLKRLIEEVRYESENNILAYNRTHNRHNRGR